MNREEILNSLIKENENLVYKIASKYSRYYNLDDLYQVGIIGIIKANEHFDSSSGTKFSTYAYKYILGEIIEYIRKDRNIIVSDEIFNLYKKYLQIKDLLFSKLEREPMLSEICDFMGLNESYLTKVIESVAFTKSLENDREFYLDNTDDIINKIFIDDALSNLDESDRLLIDYRYYKGFTQSETANLLGLSQVKVSRQEKLILSRIKNNIII